MADGFLGRWSRRKQDVREGKPLQEPEPPRPAPPVLAQQTVVMPQAADLPANAPEPAPLPTLQDAQALSIDSDFKPFVGRAVAPEVRNTAMKKLFTDPHFNVMDGLDTYIDDYTQPDPLPAAMLRQMASAQFMGLVEPEPEHPQALAQQPADDAAGAPKDPAPAPQTGVELAESAQDVAQSGVCTAIPSPLGAAPMGSEPEPGVPAPASHPEHDHAHLRLQPDDAVERPGPGHSAS
ncbi:DUF3306 domain-containing protein [Acidovorax sp. 56]|uniref:DUF3306 domain-containing protein n=1 Tax=Acidovorax sp. 56 TaxID=2035205 RepID=UPI000C167D6D|nr:DUF3306 domain-containing protein [Acidovorax sp. 56]